MFPFRWAFQCRAALTSDLGAKVRVIVLAILMALVMVVALSTSPALAASNLISGSTGKIERVRENLPGAGQRLSWREIMQRQP